MRLFLLLLGNDEPAVAKAVAVIRTLHETRRSLLGAALIAATVVTLGADAIGLAIIAGAGR